jgi:putative hydrolase of the HAD superfamily
LDGVRGYIFDYGGTIDTSGCHWGKMLWHAYERQMIPITEQEFRDAYVYAERAIGNNPIIQSSFTFYKTLIVKIRIQMEQLLISGAWNASENEYKAKHEAMVEDLYQRVKNNAAYNKNVLLRLKEKYQMALASNFYGNLNIVLEEFGLDGIFTNVIESSVVGIRKPDARFFKIVVDAMQLKAEETVSVGDSFYKDVLPAKKIGCHTIWMKGEGWNDTRYDETIPDKVITDLDELR